MKEINTETIIIMLLLLGFDRVDSILYTLVLGKLIIDNQTTKMFNVEDSKISEIFLDYVKYENGVFKLKNELTFVIDQDSDNYSNYPVSLRRFLAYNQKLVTYLNQLDFKDLIIKKIYLIGTKNWDKLNYLFSKKEQEIISNISNFEDRLKVFKLSKNP